MCHLYTKKTWTSFVYVLFGYRQTPWTTYPSKSPRRIDVSIRGFTLVVLSLFCRFRKEQESKRTLLYVCLILFVYVIGMYNFAWMRYKDMNYFRYSNNIIAKILSTREEMHKKGSPSFTPESSKETDIVGTGRERGLKSRGFRVTH